MHSVGAGELEPEMQERGKLLGHLAQVKGQVEAVHVADDDGPVRVAAGAGRIEPEVDRVEARLRRSSRIGRPRCSRRMAIEPSWGVVSWIRG
jgi:hypothetical protein